MIALLLIIILLLILVILRQGKSMAASQEVLDAVAKLQTSADNIAADIQKLLANEPNLSPEASAALQGIVDKLQSISDVVPG
jgi:predicted PurR-regulated permease PerM